MAAGEFDIDALYAALDAARTAHELSWHTLTKELNGQFKDTPSRPISASTITGMTSRRMIEGDGVLQMLRWLDMPPESFVSGAAVIGDEAALPRAGTDRILRFDTAAIHAALDAQRVERGLTWPAVASEIGGLTASGLIRLAAGGRTGFPDVMRITHWLARPAAAFVRISEK